MKRVFNKNDVVKITNFYPEYFTYDYDKFLSNFDNVVFNEGENLAFAEHKGNGVYHVHFCFHTARGREAINLTGEILREFVKKYPVRMIVGLINTDNRKALWLIRQAGWASLGTIDTDNGTCEMFTPKRNKDGSF